MKQQKIAKNLTIILAVLALFASFAGIFSDIYRDNDFIKKVWVANDIITLLFAIPVMLISLAYSLKGSLKAKMIWISSIWYMIYNYVFYLYGASFNKVFLLYVAIVTISIYSLIISIMSLDINDLRNRVNSSTNLPMKKISAFMIFFGSFIGIMWVMMAASFIFSNEVPQAIIDTGHVTGVVFATDLPLLVSPLIIGGFLLWKRNVWGYLMINVLMVKCVLYPIVLIVAGIVTYLNDSSKYDPLTPGYLSLALGCAVCLYYLRKVLTPKNT